MSPAATPSRFRAALGRPGPLLGDRAVNLTAARLDAEAAVRLAGRLQDYRRYLEGARTVKAEHAARASDVDREVVIHARQAAADASAFGIAALRTVRALHNGRVLDRLAARIHSAARTVGTVALEDEWDRLIASAEATELFQKVGARDTVVDAVGGALRGTGLELRADGPLLTVSGTIARRGVTASLDPSLPRSHPTTVTELITRGRFAQLLELTERGGPTYLQGAVAGFGDSPIADLALYGACAAQREAARHVRKLEDTGLAVYRGGEPGTLATLAAIALVCLILGTLIMLAACGDDESPNNPKSSECTFGALLASLGIGLLLAAGSPPDQSDPTNRIMGGPVVRGVLQDLVAAGSS